MTRRAAIAAILTPAVAVADQLFDGPPMHERCVVGALDQGGMRFRPINDRTEEWVILRQVATVSTREPDGWFRPVGRAAVELRTGELRLWEWNEEVIRTF